MPRPDLSSLPPIDNLRERPVVELFSDLRGVITDAMAAHPRSGQVRLGPSEIGCRCARRLGYKLAGMPEVNSQGPGAGWRPQVGTAVHEWLATIFRERNRGQPVRWLVEMKVEAGRIGDNVLDGSCDLYDRATASSIDWKVVGPTTLKTVRRSGPDWQYRVQGHTYAKGWTARGLPVDNVVVAYLPSAGDLNDAYFHSEPYDESIADRAIYRADLIASLVKTGGVEAAAQLPTEDAYCKSCPWYSPASTELTVACPGHKEIPEP